MRRLFDALAVGAAGIAAGSAGVHGMGGAGKSTLAACAARDPLVHGTVCPDGAVWLDVGNDASKTSEAVAQQLVARLAVLLQAPPEERAEWAALPPGERARLQLDGLLRRLAHRHGACSSSPTTCGPRGRRRPSRTRSTAPAAPPGSSSRPGTLTCSASSAPRPSSSR